MKNLLIFLAGAAAGAAGTYFAIKQRYDDRLEAEVEAVRDMYDERVERKSRAYTREDAYADIGRKVVEEQIANMPKDVEDEFVPAEPEVVDEDTANKYSKIVKSSAYEKPDPGELVEKTKKSRKKKDPKIFMITAGAFAASDNELKTVYLYNDGIVVDEEEEMVDNGYALLGGNDVLKLAEETGETTVYIRNLNEGVDYEVIMHDEDYGYFSEKGPEDE